MRLNPTPLIALTLLTLMLGACVQRGQVPLAAASNLDADDDKICREQGPLGSVEFANCLKNRDTQRSNAIGRADRAQRNLGEYMLNNSDSTGYMRR